MCKKVTAWQIIEEMSNRNQKVWLAPLSNIISVNTNKDKGKIQIGVPSEMSNALIMKERNNGGFLLIDSEQYDDMKKELEIKVNEKEFNVNEKDADFINDALNFYWNDAVSNLKKNDLGDIERSNYEKQKSKSKLLMDKLGAS